MNECLCNIEILEGHKIGCIQWDCPYAHAGTKEVGTYLFETACGTFACCNIKGLLMYFDADKLKITPV